MRLTGDRLPLGRGRGGSNPWRIIVYLLLIAGGFSLLRLVEVGRVQPLFQATPTPTRIPSSFVEEANAHFSAGNLEAAIDALQAAVVIEPNNASLWTELARVQTYSSDLLTTLEERRARLAQARESIEKAMQADPDSARAYTIRAFVYDWSSSAELRDSIGVGDQVRVEATLEEGGRIVGRRIEFPGSVLSQTPEPQAQDAATVVFTGVVEEIRPGEWIVSGRRIQITDLVVIQDQNRREEFLAEADTSATRALQLAPGDPYALAFRAEVLVDQESFQQALELAEDAAEQAVVVPLRDQMDIYRVYGTVLESYGRYLSAIEAYRRAVEINPNLTFLYLRIGANYRSLRDVDAALAAFDKAAKINQQLGFKDPTPYLAIGRTYVQEGQFFIAAVNIESALRINPTNPEIYARLGSVYFQARNYESAIPIFMCALDGCPADENREILCDLEIYNCGTIGFNPEEIGWDVYGLELNSGSVEYYYTYGSVLAAFAGTEEFPNACVDAERIFELLMSKYANDPIVSAIVIEGRAICASPGPPEVPSIPAETPTESP